VDKKVIEGEITYIQITKSKFLELDEIFQSKIKALQKEAGHKNPIYLKISNERIMGITTSKEAHQEIRKARTETRKVLFEKFKRKKKPWEI
jgi:hypothetical protein